MSERTTVELAQWCRDQAYDENDTLCDVADRLAALDDAAKDILAWVSWRYSADGAEEGSRLVGRYHDAVNRLNELVS